nr:MAG TPA: hypothetical protein [Bacteriophage sp.]
MSVPSIACGAPSILISLSSATPGVSSILLIISPINLLCFVVYIISQFKPVCNKKFLTYVIVQILNVGDSSRRFKRSHSHVVGIKICIFLVYRIENVTCKIQSVILNLMDYIIKNSISANNTIVVLFKVIDNVIKRLAVCDKFVELVLGYCYFLR